MPTLPEPAPKQITPTPCPVCHRAVVVAQLVGKGFRWRVLVESCAAGAGDIALTRELGSSSFRADRVSNATHYRIHAGELCAGTVARAFSADAFDRKRPPARNGQVAREIFR